MSSPSLDNLMRVLQCRQVRELARCCFGPNLLQVFPDARYPLYQTPLTPQAYEWLVTLDRNPEPLLRHLGQLHSTRLGIYFEALWRFFWEQFADCEILLHNTQIRDGHRTLGAFDFILRECNGRLLHIEAAVKFYLGYGERLQSPASWIGPNANDRLAYKLEHLQNHQLPLLDNPQTQTQLRSLDIDVGQIEQCVLLKGYLFSPNEHALAALPDGANPAAGGQHWYSLGELLRMPCTNQYALIPRNHWLAPIRLHSGVIPLSGKQLHRALCLQVGKTGRPKMVATLASVNGAWVERERFFVVPDHWPGTARPSRSK